MSLFKKPLGRVMLALLLALGMAVAWSYLLFLVADTGWWRGRGRVGGHEQLAVREDGVPLVVTHDPQNGQQIRRWDHAPLKTDPPYGQLAGASCSAPRPGGVARWSDRVVSCAPSWWYFVHNGREDGHGYFVGFDPNSKHQIGFIGLRGFQRDQPSDDQKIPFDGNGWVHLKMVCPHGYLVRGAPPNEYGYGQGYGSPYLFLISRGRLLRLDLPSRSLETVYDEGDLISVSVRNVRVSMMPVGPVTTLGSLPPVRQILEVTRTDELALRTHNALLFADTQGAVTASFVLPQALQQATLTAYLLNDQQCLLVDDWSPEPNELIWLNRDGTIAERQELNLDYPVSLPLTSRWLFQAAAVPVPAALGFRLVHSYVNPTPFVAYQDGPVMRWLAFVLPLLISIVLAYFCFRRQQKYRLGAAWGWALFVLLLGVPGYLAYRLHRQWPTLDRCLHCQAVIPVRGDRCPQCSEEFPLPEQTGVEIFA